MKGIYERKQHFKMYKAKKQWLLAGLTVLGGLFLAGMPVAQADTAGYTPTTVTPKQTATEQQVNAAPTVSASAQVVPASQATVPASQQAAPVAMYKAVAEQATPTVSTLKLTEESKDGHWYLKDANATDPAKQYVNGWHSLSNNRVAYYDPSTYQMVYREHNIDGKWYYFNEQSGDVQEGWYRLPDGREVYYDVHKKQNGVDGEGMLHGMSAKPSSDKSAYFYFNDDSGAQETGFKQVNNHTYYFAPTRVQNQEKQINGAWYYFKADGTMATGFTTLPSGKPVYYQSNGQMAYGQQMINGRGYYFIPQSGEEVRNREVNLNGHWYFYRQDGTMATGFTTLPSGKPVYYQSNGQMAYGEQNINGRWYYFIPQSGELVKGFFTLPDKRVVYYATGADGTPLGMAHGMTKIGDATYYFNLASGAQEKGVVYNEATKALQYYAPNTGKLVTNSRVAGYQVNAHGEFVLSDGEHQIDGQWYNVKNGKAVTGWQTLSNNRLAYYDLTTAAMVKGERNIDGYWYYFTPASGAAVKQDFVNLPTKRVYYDAQGHMVYGEQFLYDHWYFFDRASGAMATGFTKLPDGRTVYYNNQGQMQYGWQTLGNKTYYFDKASGAMYTGKHTIDDKTYTFDNNGVEEAWGWPFPNVGQGYFSGAQRFGVNAGGEFRLNGFHDGLDFGSIDHPGSTVHAIHAGTVTSVGYMAGLDWYVTVDTGEYLVVYQEAFSSRNQIAVKPGQQIGLGDTIGYRNTSHLHIGITRQKNFNVALANSFNNNGTWLNPLDIILNNR